MNDLAVEELTILRHRVERLCLGDESSSTQPFGVLWLELAEEGPLR